VLARRDEGIHPAVRGAVERSLREATRARAVEAARRLVRQPDEPRPETDRGEAERERVGSEAVDEDRGGRGPKRARERATAREDLQRERQRRYGDDREPHRVIGRVLGDPPVIEMTSRQGLRVAGGEHSDRRLRVVHVTPTLFGAAGIFGGGERYPLELARALSSHVSCRLVTFGPRAARLREASGLELVVLPAVARLRGHAAQPLNPAFVAQLLDADIVHAHQLGSVASRASGLIARISGRGAAVTDHGVPGHRLGGLALFHAFLAVSRFSARTVDAPATRTRLIYGGADPVRFRPDGGPREGILYVGRITPHKGLDRLIEALPDGSSLSVAGSVGHDRLHPERDYPALLRRLARGKRVRFLGAVPDAGLPVLYRRARVLALPSLTRTRYGRDIPIPELLGLAAIEAMASGTAVVASRVGGLPEIVVDGETGFLVEPGDVDALRDRLSLLVSDESAAVRMGTAARERVLERFTWERCAERCLEAYRLLCAPELARPAAAA
jgi:glycosyltransferase involved in cell wall biosynthesis